MLYIIKIRISKREFLCLALSMSMKEATCSGRVTYSPLSVDEQFTVGNSGLCLGRGFHVSSSGIDRLLHFVGVC